MIGLGYAPVEQAFTIQSYKKKVDAPQPVPDEKSQSKLEEEKKRVASPSHIETPPNSKESTSFMDKFLELAADPRFDVVVRMYMNSSLKPVGMNDLGINGGSYSREAFTVPGMNTQQSNFVVFIIFALIFYMFLSLILKKG
jgi:hypothetical protein